MNSKLRAEGKVRGAGSCACLTPAELLSLHCFIQRELAAFFYGNHAMNVLVSRHGDVDDIVSRIQIELKRRRLIQNSIIHRNLRAFGLSFDVHSTHASRVPATE